MPSGPVPVRHPYRAPDWNPLYQCWSEEVGFSKIVSTPSSSAPELRLGAALHPDASAPLGLSSIASLETKLGRKLDYDMHYYQINYAYPGPDLVDDAANGRTPIVSLNCGTYANVDIARGRHDAAIDTMANALKSYGHPVLVRYLWEMNLPTSANSRAGCTGPNDTNAIFNPADFIAAWDHLRARFVADGVTNVKWFWCPNDGGKTFRAYYPGDSQVDYVGADIYDRTPGNIIAFSSHFQATYAAIEKLGAGKPFIVGESAAQSADQVTYFNNQHALFSADPRIVAWVYFDSTGPLGDWRVTPDTADFAAFRALVNPTVATQPGHTRYLLGQYEVQHGLAADLTQRWNKALANTNPYIILTTAQGPATYPPAAFAPPSWGPGTKYLYRWTSEAQMEADLAQRLPNGAVNPHFPPAYVTACMYDNEPATAPMSPANENADPPTYYRRAAAACHRAGKTFIATAGLSGGTGAAPYSSPGRYPTLAAAATAERCNLYGTAPTWDGQDIQSQTAEGSTSAFIQNVTSHINDVHNGTGCGGNLTLPLITAGIGNFDNNSYMKNYHISIAQQEAAMASIPAQYLLWANFGPHPCAPDPLHPECTDGSLSGARGLLDEEQVIGDNVMRPAAWQNAPL